MSLREEWRLVGKGVIRALLTLVLLLQGVLSGHGALRAVGPAFDPAIVLCSAHADPANVPDRDDKPPAEPHDLCCILLCGAGGGPPPDLLPAAGPVLPVPSQQAPGFGRPANGRLHLTPYRACHGARAPPIPV